MMSTPRTWLVPSLLLLATLAAYIPAMRGGFVWDDDRYVSENATLQTVQGLRQIWLSPGATVQYYPLVFTSFWVESRLWGRNPAGYHVVNILLHGVTAILLWRVLQRLEVPGAVLAAGIFAVHPVHVESVAWITERKNVLSGVFYVSALMAYLRYRPLSEVIAVRGERSPGRHRLWWAVAFLLFVCAVLSKTAACSLPVAIVVLTWWKRGRVTWGDLLPLVPFAAVAIPLGLITMYVEKVHVGAEGSAWSLTVAGRIVVAGRAVWFYLEKLVWPSTLTFVYPRWDVDPAIWWQWCFLAGVVVVMAVLWVLHRRIGRAPFAAAAFFLITLAPALGFFDIYYMQYAYVADHFQYLASMGPIALAAAGLVRLPGLPGGAPRQVAGCVAGGILLAVLGVLTWRQSAVYSNIETLWGDTLKKNPSAWLAHNNLGVLLLERGDVQQAIRHLSESVRYNPGYVLGRNNLGSALATAGDLPAAAREFREAVRLQENYAPALKNLANVLTSLGRPEEAAAYYRKALQLRPGWPEASNNLAWILATHPDPAVRDGSEAVRLAEGACAATMYRDPLYLETLAAAYAEAGSFPRAVEAARRAILLLESRAAPEDLVRLKTALSLYHQKRPYCAAADTSPW